MNQVLAVYPQLNADIILECLRYVKEVLNARENESRLCRQLSKQYRLPHGYRRIYHYHIRKAAGTSINHIFLQSDGGDGPALYEQLTSTLDNRFVHNGKVFVGWTKEYIEEGSYFYAFSHMPSHALRLPPGTFTLSCFRDPVRRVISHYTMLMEYKINGVDHPCMKTEGPWLGESFADFCRTIPPDHLYAQLYMYSPRLDVDEACERVRSLCSYYFFTDTFSQGIEDLSSLLGLELRPLHSRTTAYKVNPSDAEISYLRERLAPEYAFIERLRLNWRHGA